MPEYYSMVLFFLITGILAPSFGTFSYYFMLDVVGISKSTYALLTVLGFATMFIGTQLYISTRISQWEYHSMMLVDACIAFVLAPFTLLWSCA